MPVLVIAEHSGDVLKTSTKQAIKAAQKFNHEVHVLLVGFNLNKIIDEACKLEKVTKVLAFEAFHLQHPVAEDYAPLIASIASGYSTVLGSHTSFTRDVLPRVAAILDTPMVSEVIEVLDSETFKRPIYAGNLIATVKYLAETKVLTVRGSRFKPAELRNDESIAEVELLAVPSGGLGLATWASESKQSSDRPDLSVANIVVSGGRSLGSEEKFLSTLEPLAKKLNAAIGASRAAVDAGYAPNDAQVGQTGTQVAPDIYMAFGISGSIQHTAGIKDSKVIVAVNLDPEAPIFQVADYGLVADLFDVIPKLTESV
jgi:electron transfer flavoprotein alpha subunit